MPQILRCFVVLARIQTCKHYSITQHFIKWLKRGLKNQSTESFQMNS
jgi:hypothetical protein